MLYGHNGTVHGTERLDVVVDKKGEIKEVWFRCMPLPYRVVRRDKVGEDLYVGGPTSVRLVAIEYENDKRQQYQVFKDVRDRFPGYEWIVADNTTGPCMLIVGFFGKEEVAREFARQMNDNGRVEFV